MRGLTRTITLVAVVILAVMSASVLADGAIQLANADMENGFTSGVANGWTSFWVSGGLSGGVSYFDSTSTRHRYFHSQGVNLGNIGTSSNFMLKCYSGIYQRISVTPGKLYTASAWHYIQMIQSSTNVVSVSIGIDPSGGTNPTSSTIVWSVEAWNGFYSESVGDWKQMIATARAASDQITVFLRCTIIPSRISMVQPDKTYFDQVYVMESDAPIASGTLANWGFEGAFTQPAPLVADAYPANWAPWGSSYGDNNGSGTSISVATSNVI